MSVADSVVDVDHTEFERRRVRRALDRLTAMQRQAVELAYFGGHTYREVAVLLDVPEGTIKTRIRDGMIRLRDELGAPAMSDIEIHHLGAAYALDALDERERAAYEAHFATCEICRTDVREFRAAAAELGSLTTTTPPPDVKAPGDGRDRHHAPALAAPAGASSASPTGAAAGSSTASWRSPPRRCSSSPVPIVLGGRDDDSFGDEVAAMMEDPTFAMVELGGEGEGSFKVAWTADRAAVIGGDLPDPGRRQALRAVDDRRRPDRTRWACSTRPRTARSAG